MGTILRNVPDDLAALAQERGYARPQTESEAAVFLWNCCVSHSVLLNEEVTYVSAPMKTMQNGRVERPRTLDTLELWANQAQFLKRKNTRLIAISQNPYVPYQDRVARSFLDKEGWLAAGVSLETVGGEAPESATVPVYLDTLARCIYEDQKN